MRSATTLSSLPTFIIIGTMKGGTTSLFRYMATHPDISVSTKKETNFFLGRHEYERGLDWYRDQFDPTRSARGEASPNYTKRHSWPGTAARIAATVPDVRLLFVARDPIARIVSHYMHNVAQGREHAPFSEAISGNQRYLLTSRYAYQLAPYLEHFERDRLMVIDSDDLRVDMATTMKAVFDFIGVDTGHAVDTTTQFHRSSDKTTASVLDQRIRNRRLRAVLRPVLPARLTARQPVARPEPTAADIAFMTGGLRDDVARFRTLTGLAFDQWHRGLS